MRMAEPALLALQTRGSARRDKRTLNCIDSTQKVVMGFDLQVQRNAVRARGGGVLDALTASLGDGTTRFAFRRSGVGERNEGWAAPIVAGVALSLLFQAIDNVAAAAA